MNKIIKHDDSDLIWFDYNNLDTEALRRVKISYFDIFNMPTKYHHTDIIGEKHYEPKFFELEGYFICFFKDYLSETGWACECVIKDRNLYNQKLGYKNGKPEKTEY